MNQVEAQLILGLRNQIHTKAHIALWYEGELHQSYALCVFLAFTRHPVTVFLPTTISDTLSNEKNQTIFNRNKDILSGLAANFRQFSLIEIPTDFFEDDVLLLSPGTPAYEAHCLNVLSSAYPDIKAFILLHDQLTMQTIPIAEDFFRFKQQCEIKCPFIFPLSTLSNAQVLEAATATQYVSQWVNIPLVKHRYQAIWTQLSSIDAAAITRKAELHLHYANDSALSQVWVALAHSGHVDGLITLARMCGSRLPSAMLLHCLVKFGLCHPNHERLVAHVMALLNQEERDCLGQELGYAVVDPIRVYSHAAHEELSALDTFLERKLTRDTQALFNSEEQFISFDFYVRAYGMSPRTKDELALALLEHIDLRLPEQTQESPDSLKQMTEAEFNHYALVLNMGYRKLALSRLLNLGADAGELLLAVVRIFPEEKASVYVHYLFEHFESLIHPFQRHEALFLANTHNKKSIVKKLIAYGAQENAVQVFIKSWAVEKTKRDLNTLNFRYRESTQARPWDRALRMQLLERLGNPQKHVPPVYHVTGSNGKGSVCAFLRSILEHNGYRVHSFTNPAILRENENVFIANKQIEDSVFYHYFKQAICALEAFLASEDFPLLLKQFNLTQEQFYQEGMIAINLALPATIKAFSEHRADATVIEVVVGGEFDYTNIFDESTTAATIINTIIQDDNHSTDFHFRTLESRALLKAGLSKPLTPVFSARQEVVVLDMIKATALSRQAPVFVAGSDFFVDIEAAGYFKFQGFDQQMSLPFPNLLGACQVDNAALALAALIGGKKQFRLDEAKTAQGILHTEKRARMAWIHGNPRFRHFTRMMNSPKAKICYGTVKDGLGLKSFLSNMEKYHKDNRFVFVMNIPAISERVLSGVDALFEYQLNVKSLVIFNTLHEPDFTVLMQRLKGLKGLRQRATVKTFLSSAICTTPLEDQDVLCIISFGVEIFPKNMALLLESFPEENYGSDLKFAKTHKLIKNPS